MTEIQPELAIRLLATARAIDDILVAGHTLRSNLKPGHPPFGAFDQGVWRPTPLQDGVARYGNTALFALWQQCRAVETLRVAWTAKAGIAPPEVPDEPDEAPGLALPEADATAVTQDRLVGADT